MVGDGFGCASTGAAPFLPELPLGAFLEASVPALTACCSARACCLLVALSILPLRLTLSVAAATEGRVVTLRAALMGEEEAVAGAAVIRAFLEVPLEPGDCFFVDESLPGVTEAFLGGRPRFRGAGVSAAA